MMAILEIFNEFVKTRLITGRVSLVQFRHQSVPLFLFLWIEREIRVNYPGKIVVGLLRIWCRVPSLSAVFGVFVFRCRFFRTSPQLLGLLSNLLIIGNELVFFLGDLGLDLVKLSIKPAD